EVEGTTLWRERHRDWYLKWIEGVEKELWGLQQTEWFDRLEMEHNNLKAALKHTLEQGQGELLARLSGSLWRFWLARGHLDEGRRWLEAALSHISGDTMVRANILHGVGSLASHQHDFINARILLEESLTLYLKLEKQHDAAYVLYSLGDLAYHRNDNAQTFTFFEKSLELLQNLGDLRGIARLLCAQGRTILRQGEYERAKEICKESLSLSRKLGDAQSLADSLMNLALVVLEGGDYKRTSTLCEESQLLQERLGDKRG